MQTFREAFYEATAAYGADRTLTDGLWQEIEDAYTDPIRFYHNLHHLEHMHSELALARSQLRQPHITTLATAYHDIVCHPEANDNEEQSTAIASLRLRRLSMPGADIIKCCAQILVTKTHKRDDDPDTQLFTDADVAILGAAPERYEQYAKNIKLEYAFAGEMVYKAARRQVLQHFMSMPKIYHTDHFGGLYEVQAQKNIRAEWERLEQ